MVLVVRYFAGLATLLGRDEETLPLAGTSAVTVAHALDRLIERHPALGPQRAFFRVARNTDFVRDDDALADGDVLALLPPFSGG